MTSKKTSFILYHSYKKMFKLLSMEQRGELITAILDYETQGFCELELSDIVNMAFVTIKDALDRDSLSYEETCKRRSENGKKGGRPRIEESEKSNCFFEKAKKADTDTATDIETDTDIDTETETETDIDTVAEAGAGAEAEAEAEAKAECYAAQSSAACAPRAHAAACAPRIDINLKNLLLERDIPASYYEDRIERALDISERTHKNVADILEEWYSEDKPSTSSAKPRTGYTKRDSVTHVSPKKAQEADEWLEARIAKLYG